MPERTATHVDEILDLYERLTRHYTDSAGGTVEAEAGDSRETLKQTLAKFALGDLSGQEIATVLGLVRTVMHRAVAVEAASAETAKRAEAVVAEVERLRAATEALRAQAAEARDEAALRRDEAVRTVTGVEEQVSFVHDRAADLDRAVRESAAGAARVTALHEQALNTLRKANETLVFTLNERRRYEIDHEKMLVHRNYLLLLTALLAVVIAVGGAVMFWVLADKNATIAELAGERR